MSDLTDRLRCFDRQTCTEAAERIETLEAELAAMRAGGEPVAEMVPCHTPSGKRVAVIPRFQHLPIGTKLYTHPQPAAQDAARYRWLRMYAIGAFITVNGTGPVSVYHLCKIPAIPGIPEETDAAIDAAIAAQQGEKT